MYPLVFMKNMDVKMQVITKYKTMFLIVITIFVLAVIFIGLIFFRLTSKENNTLKNPTPDFTSSLEIKKMLNDIINTFQHDQQENKKLFQQIILENNKINKKISEIDADLKSMKVVNEDVAFEKMPNSTSNETKKVSESELSFWMEEKLENEGLDMVVTEKVREQAVKNINRLPGINLDDIQCGADFCRATFSHVSGKSPDVLDLYGEPPFMSDGFTINEIDGRVSIFFTQSGESIEDLKNKVIVSSEY